MNGPAPKSRPLSGLKAQVAHLWVATGYSLSGLAATARSETAFRHEIAVLPLLPLIAWLSGLELWAWPLVVVAWLLVMALELLNTGLEALSDLVSPERHPLVKKAKDAGSAAIFLAICANALLWAGLLYFQA